VAPFNHQAVARIAIAVTLVAALGVAGCGRKGPLEPPPSASLAGDTLYPGEPPPPPESTPKKPARPFFLDFLL
jgi:predicted small lipoprotein YifL